MTFIETKKRLRDKVFVQEQPLGRWVVLIDYDYYDVIMSSRMSSPRPGRCSRNLRSRNTGRMSSKDNPMLVRPTTRGNRRVMLEDKSKGAIQVKKCVVR